jgi:iron complex outermembrane receptor protein
MLKHRQFLSLILTSTSLGLGTFVTPALAQDAGNDIIVTARRSEERLQDVPISITVLSQDAITKRNIVSTADLGQYVPSLSSNQQFGPEKSSFVLRGFTQEGKTSPSVGVYFADVIAPRSFGGTTSGNGAGVGSVFDLQNIQVLKGPQGTLFGRNTTGGDILLVPQKPKDTLGGYIEGTLGDYNLHRVQAVLNVPLSDTLRVRGGVDWNERDGYLKNHSGIGPARFDNTNYFAARLSVVADLTPDLENYTIGSYSKSHTNGDVPTLRTCSAPAGFPFTFPALAAALRPYSCDQIARQAARGDGLYDIENDNPDPFEKIEQWQVINTTTWRASDTLTFKNIISYAQYREKASFSLNGTNLISSGEPLVLTGLFGFPFVVPTAPGQYFKTIELHPGFSGYNSAQSTFTEEFQIHGRSGDGRLDWQAGVYFELSKPLGFNSGLTPIFINCTDVNNFVCTNPLFIGSISDSQVKDTFNNKGIYAQASYKITDRLTMTGGIRYTVDKMDDLSENLNINVPVSGTGIRSCQNQIVFPGGTPVTSDSKCDIRISQTWKRPTWLIDLEYKPSDDLMVYAKYSRGYRQGSINSNNLGLEVVGPEKVDTYEVGAKTSFRGTMPGYFNVTGFYNQFSDQQLAVNTVVAPAFQGKVSPSQPIVNAGRSRIWGIEVDAAITPFRGLKLDVGYAYLNTRLQQFTPPPTPVYYSILLPTADVGGPLALSPKNRITLSGTYTLPLDEKVGKVSFGVTYTYTDANQAVSQAASPNFYLLTASNLVNLSVDWDTVMSAPIDLSFFMTNATNEARLNYPSGGALATYAIEGGRVNQPRMFGFRVKYHFGD